MFRVLAPVVKLVELPEPLKLAVLVFRDMPLMVALKLFPEIDPTKFTSTTLLLKLPFRVAEFREPVALPSEVVGLVEPIKL